MDSGSNILFDRIVYCGDIRQTMKQALIYSLKVWLTAVFTAPFLILLISILKESETVQGGGKFVFAVILFSLFMTSPCWFILFQSAYYVDRWFERIMVKKLLLTLIGIGLSFAPFFVYFDKNIPARRDNIMALCYSFTITAGIWYYRLKPLNDLQ